MPKKVRTTKNRSEKVIATSQVSRFHTETLETLSNDIDLKQVCISIGARDLLVDTHLKLFSGVHYGLVGPNGTGKTTLLKCIGYKTLTGLPTNIRALLVEQMNFEKEPDKTVLEFVLESDHKRIHLLKQSAILEKALDSGNGLVISKAVRSINLLNQRRKFEAAEKLALERSGARGAKARRLLNAEEEALKALEAVSLEDDSTDPNDVVIAQSLLTEIHDSLSIYDSEEVIKTEAKNILKGLGFTEEMQISPAKLLSGGWRIRASLASALLIKPDILLLDEPTNHLDFPTILWLQKYLANLVNTTLLIVSHNRSFLNAVAEEIIVLKDKSLTYHKGNYDEYVEDFHEKQAFLKSKAEAIDKKKEAAVKSIEKSISIAKKSGDDKKMSAAASKKKKLDRLGMDVNEKGHRFKLNRDRVGFHNTIRDDVIVEKELTPDVWKVEEPYTLRYQGELILVNQVGFRYPKSPRYVFTGATMSVSQRARIGIVGANGQGKSTLMNILSGDLKPTTGTIQWPGNAKIGTFSQHNAEEFITKYSPESTPVSILLERYPDKKEGDYRAHLGMFGIRNNTAINPISSLSGGELARVEFALNFFGSSPHILILDEPTNHLDMMSIESLIQVLKNYKGAVIISSHDEYFLSQIVEEVYTIDNRKLIKLEGGLPEYVKITSKKIKSS